MALFPQAQLLQNAINGKVGSLRNVGKVWVIGYSMTMLQYTCINKSRNNKRLKL
jgi:hypothetical protein